MTASETIGADVDQYVSFYGGWTYVDDVTFEASSTDPLLTGIYNYNGENGVLLGVRYGIWHHYEWEGWGLACDLSHFSCAIESDSSEIGLIPLSLLLLYRYPIPIGDGNPLERLHIYGGPGVSIAAAQISTPSLPDFQSAFGVGASLHAGLAWNLHRNIGIFIEYRYMYFTLTDDGYNFHTDAQGTLHMTDYETTVSAHQIASGVSISF